MSLIITTGDISDADGFICLADYAKNTEANILFIMNYPAYFRFAYDKEHIEADLYEGFNYGLKALLERDWNLQSTKKKILELIGKIKDKLTEINMLYNLLIALSKNITNNYDETIIQFFIDNLGIEIPKITTENNIVIEETPFQKTLKQFINEIIIELTKYKLRDKYMAILKKFGITNINNKDNLDNLKLAYTKVAYFLVHNIFNEAKSQSGGKKKIKGGTGNISFTIGGTNDKNPFSISSIKNELFVYADFIHENLEKIFLVLIDDGLFEISQSSYDNVYLDMCGSVAFYENNLKTLIENFKEQIKGFFIMGGVLSDVVPFTIKLIKNVVHRPYFATMNQYYSNNTFLLLSQELLKSKIPFFVLPNHAILTDPDLIGFIQNFFGEINKTLFDICKTYYNLFGGAKKPFDFMISRTIVNFIKGDLIVPSSPQSFMYVEKKYGGTFLTDNEDLTTFDELKSFKILQETDANTDDNNLISKMKGKLIRFPCHILSIDELTDIDSKKEMSYIIHHTPAIYTYNIILSKYNSKNRKNIGINGGFKQKIIKRIRKY